MDREQVKKLFQLLFNIYPTFEVTKEKLDIWHGFLREQNPAKVMMRAEQFVIDNKFPPTIADLVERKQAAHNKDFLKQVEEWKREAVGEYRG